MNKFAVQAKKKLFMVNHAKSWWGSGTRVMHEAGALGRGPKQSLQLFNLTTSMEPCGNDVPEPPKNLIDARLPKTPLIDDTSAEPPSLVADMHLQGL